MGSWNRVINAGCQEAITSNTGAMLLLPVLPVTAAIEWS